MIWIDESQACAFINASLAVGWRLLPGLRLMPCFAEHLWAITATPFPGRSLRQSQNDREMRRHPTSALVRLQLSVMASPASLVGGLSGFAHTKKDLPNCAQFQKTGNATADTARSNCDQEAHVATKAQGSPGVL